MRWFMKLLIIAALGWSGYWVVGATAQEKLFANWLETSQAQGWVAETGDMQVTGFPNRFDTMITQLNILGPRGDWGWQAEGFQIFALTYQPNHIILAWPGKQVISNPQGSITIQGTEMRGSIELAPNTDLALQRLRVEATELAVESSLGWEAFSSNANFALFQDQDQSNKYRLGADFLDVTIPPEYMAPVVQLGQNTDVISKIHVSAYVNFLQEINRKSLETGLPAWTSLEIEALEINWGRANLTLSGSLAPGGNGYIEGVINFHVSNWQMLFAAFEQMSPLPPPQLALVEAALLGLSGGNDLEFSLRFENGKALIGPFAIGSAPINPLY